mmetsp:Transcript_101476/g.254366  ORF Transcript_101476/g.254366 Transcript_101476/m.254366 type:complete len:289 (+) Transcript_101476:596-1462(+)
MPLPGILPPIFELQRARAMHLVLAKSANVLHAPAVPVHAGALLDAVAILALVPRAVRPRLQADPVPHALLPLAVEDRAVGVRVHAVPVLLALGPLASVRAPVGRCVDATTMRYVLCGLELTPVYIPGVAESLGACMQQQSASCRRLRRALKAAKVKVADKTRHDFLRAGVQRWHGRHRDSAVHSNGLVQRLRATARVVGGHQGRRAPEEGREDVPKAIGASPGAWRGARRPLLLAAVAAELQVGPAGLRASSRGAARLTRRGRQLPETGGLLHDVRRRRERCPVLLLN